MLGTVTRLVGRMPLMAKPLTQEQLQELLYPPKKTVVRKTEPAAQFVVKLKPDPLKLPQAGEPQKGDKGDIWAQWIKQGRTGARELIERWAA